MQDRREKPAETPRAHELTAFELALVSGGGVAPDSHHKDHESHLAAKPPTAAKS